MPRLKLEVDDIASIIQKCCTHICHLRAEVVAASVIRIGYPSAVLNHGHDIARSIDIVPAVSFTFGIHSATLVHAFNNTRHGQ